MQNRDNVTDRLRRVLSDKLKARYGTRISAQRFSDQFNLNARGAAPISRETARRWIQGSALPEYGHLVVLINWLDIDPALFLGGRTGAPVRPERTYDKGSGIKEGRDRSMKLLELLDDLDEDSRLTIFTIAEAMKRQTKDNRTLT
jgi:transcriptional regulator with XRE-family HTH domain